jgi:hypothetical protein
VAHVQLAYGRFVEGSVRFAVDDEAAGAANAFTAVMIEDNGDATARRELLIDDIEHLEEGHMLRDVGRAIRFETAFLRRGVLPPDVQCQVHGVFPGYL